MSENGLNGKEWLTCQNMAQMSDNGSDVKKYARCHIMNLRCQELGLLFIGWRVVQCSVCCALLTV